MNPERFYRLIQDKNADFKTAVECLSYIKDNNIDFFSFENMEEKPAGSWA